MDDCEVFEVAMVEPASIGTRNLKVLVNGEIDTPVGHSGVATLSKRKDHARYCQEFLRVVSAPRKATMSSSRSMLINNAIGSWRHVRCQHHIYRGSFLRILS